MTALTPDSLSTTDQMHRSQVHYGSGGFGMSSGKFSESFPGRGGSSAKAEALCYRVRFAARWQRFIRANFDSPEHAAHAFGVDGSTAKKWWEGSHAPSGFAVGYAYDRFPAEALTPLRGAA